jgi:hypothetical protein
MASSRPLQQRQGASSEDVLLLLVKAFCRLKGCNMGEGQLTEDQLQGWLGQLVELTASGENDTVKALYNCLKQEHSWVNLGDVFSALVGVPER